MVVVVWGGNISCQAVRPPTNSHVSVEVGRVAR